MINNRLGALDIAEATTPAMKHLISSFGKEAANVDISLTILVLEAAVERFDGRARGRNGTRNGRFLLNQLQQSLRDRWSSIRLRSHNAIVLHVLRRGRSGVVSENTAGRTIHDGNAVVVSTVSIVRSGRNMILVGRD